MWQLTQFSLGVPLPTGGALARGGLRLVGCAGLWGPSQNRTESWTLWQIGGSLKVRFGLFTEL